MKMIVLYYFSTSQAGDQKVTVKYIQFILFKLNLRIDQFISILDKKDKNQKKKSGILLQSQLLPYHGMLQLGQ